MYARDVGTHPGLNWIMQCVIIGYICIYHHSPNMWLLSNPMCLLLSCVCVHVCVYVCACVWCVCVCMCVVRVCVHVCGACVYCVCACTCMYKTCINFAIVN